MTQLELEKQLDEIVVSHTGILNNTEEYIKFTDNIAYEFVQESSKNFIALNRSFKLKNIKINLKNIICFLSENALAVGMTYDSMDVYKAVLLVLIDIAKICVDMTIKLDEDMVKIVQCLHKQNAYKTGIQIEQLKNTIQSKRPFEEVVNDLVECKSIVVQDEMVFLCEKVVVHNKKEKHTHGHRRT